MRTLCTLLFLAAMFPAEAAQLPIGTLVPFTATVCDTKEQVLDILSTSEHAGFDESVAVLRKYENVEDDKGEPACGSLQGYVTIEANEGAFRDLQFPDGTKSVYVLRINAGGEILYAISFIDVEPPI